MELPERGFVQLYQDGPDSSVLHHLLTEETACLPAVEGGWSLEFDQVGAGWISSPAQQVWVAELLDCRVAKLDSGYAVVEQGSQQPLSESKRAHVEHKVFIQTLGSRLAELVFTVSKHPWGGAYCYWFKQMFYHNFQ